MIRAMINWSRGRYIRMVDCSPEHDAWIEFRVRPFWRMVNLYAYYRMKGFR